MLERSCVDLLMLMSCFLRLLTPLDPTTEIRRGASGFKNHGSKAVTGFINQNIEEIMASRVVQSGTALSLSDVKASGKDRLKQINQAARTKKKSRVAQKLQAIERKIQENEEK